MAQQPKAGGADWREPARRLYEQRLAPLAGQWRAAGELPAVAHLIVLPSEALRGVPLEALFAAGAGKAPVLTVSYAPSGTLFAHLQKQRALAVADARPRLLALGDPDFEPAPAEKAPAPPEHGLLIKGAQPGGQAARAGLRPGDVLLNYAGQKLACLDDLKAALEKHAKDKVGEPGLELACWREGKALTVRVAPGPLGMVLDLRPAAEAVRARREVGAALARSRGAGLKRLPHTRQEVRALAGLFEDSTVLLGGKANEAELDGLARKGQLKEHRYLHLATHGFANSEQPLQSYLALAGGASSAGRLSAARVREEWELDCDLVVLSACQTALGKYASGEGYLGFAQAFFLAGARSLVLSLWNVDDEATALLMVRFYQNLLGKRPGLKKPMPKAEALQEAKDWLRNLSAKEVQAEAERLPRGKAEKPVPLRKEGRPFAHPYYWAAFVLVGDPN
jgi:CHAT domain-containing protein